VTNEELRSLLRDLRISAGLTQRELAKRVGFTQGWVNKVESGRCGIDLEIVEKWAGACDKVAHLHIGTDLPTAEEIGGKILALDSSGRMTVLELVQVWKDLDTHDRRTLRLLLDGWRKSSSLEAVEGLPLTGT